MLRSGRENAVTWRGSRSLNLLAGACRHPRRISVRLLTVSQLVLITALLVLPAYLQTATADDELERRSSTTADSHRETALRLLQEIHDPRPQVAQAARGRLAELGVPAAQMRYAELLFHPRQSERLRLASSLRQAPEPFRSELRIELLHDTDPVVRREMLSGVKSTAEISDGFARAMSAQLTSEQNPAVAAQLDQLTEAWAMDQVTSRASRPEPARFPDVDARPLHREEQLPAPIEVNARPAHGAEPGRLNVAETLATQSPRTTRPRMSLASSEADSTGRRTVVPSVYEVTQSDDVDRIFAGQQPVSNIQLLAAESGSDKLDDIFPILDDSEETSSSSVSATVGRQPSILNRPIEAPDLPEAAGLAEVMEDVFGPEIDAPRGFTGPSGILSPDVQQDSHFVPQPDRWRNGYPRTDRYGLSYPWTVDYLGVPGNLWDPYNQNVLKGDYPVIGQHTFLNVTGTSQTQYDWFQVPTPTTPFESTQRANQEEFFGQAEQQFINQNFFLRIDLFHGNQAGFKPLDWQIRLTPVFNMNELHLRELGVVNPDVRDGRTRFRDYHTMIQEYFAEVKLADLSPDYDFVSARAGNQLFNSDFRGFIFFDTNRSVRLFGSRFSNRHQFNLLFYDMVEKDTNSGLNRLRDRDQNVLIANYYIQDFIFPGYTFQTSFHWNHDEPGTEFDRNGFLVRPDPTGVFQPHGVDAYYFGFAGDGHMGRFNVSNAFYWVTGRDTLNPIAGQQLTIDAKMAALELSYDRDWARFRASFFWSSGDGNASDDRGEGFDSIMDNPTFAGGEFSYWQRQAIQLFGVRLVNNRSLVPDLRSSKTQGQSNFTNPGLLLFNLGFDADITPKLRLVANANYLMFDKTQVLETFTFQGGIDKRIGLDLSAGFEWRPFHNDNMIMLFGASALVPDQGFKDLYRSYNGDTDTRFASFVETILTF